MDPFIEMATVTTEGGFDQLMAQLMGGLIIAMVLAVVIERSLSFLFALKAFQMLDNEWLPFIDLKRYVSLTVCLLFCFHYPLDLMAFMLQRGPWWMGKLMTGFLLAGGSSGIVDLVRTLKRRQEELQEAKVVQMKNGSG